MLNLPPSARRVDRAHEARQVVVTLEGSDRKSRPHSENGLHAVVSLAKLRGVGLAWAHRTSWQIFELIWLKQTLLVAYGAKTRF
jgi:hypothetical protein